jgi:hypothetical protein
MSQVGVGSLGAFEGCRMGEVHAIPYLVPPRIRKSFEVQVHHCFSLGGWNSVVPIYLSMCLSIYLSIYLSTYLPISVSLSLYLSTYLQND